MVKRIDTESTLTYKDIRPKTTVDDIATFQDQEEGWTYKGVCVNYKHIPLNVEYHEKQGYEIVWAKKPVVDDRSFSPDNSLKESTLPQPIMKTTADGYKYIFMRIRNEDLKAVKEQEALDYAKKYKKSVEKLTLKKGQVNVKDGEIKLGDTNNE